MQSRWHVVIVVSWVASVWTSGCSWVMVRQAPADYRPERAETPPSCTASLGPAIGDTWDAIALGGGLVGTGTLTLALLDLTPLVGAAQIVGGVGLGSMFGASAAHGYASAHRCRRLRDRFQTTLYRRLDAHDAPETSEDPKPPD